MQQENGNTQVIDLTKEIQSGVKFDPEAVSLFGIYKDELSLFRAKKSWTEILESNFLLESNYDYSLQKTAKPAESSFVLKCSFLTACGRYAFWRLTNDQAPEAQYMIETAHIPNCDLASDMFLSAPDLSPIFKNEIIEDAPIASTEKALDKTARLIGDIKNIFDKIAKTFKLP
jgi:hypothetical protein